MSDRTEQARAKSWRRYPEEWDPYNEETVDDWGYSKCQREAFCAGVEWADANPQPHTITRAELGDAAVEALARVREMHGPSEYGCASECRDDDGGLSWPCATYKATEVEA